MEIITLFGVVCLMLILVLGISKQRRAKRLACAIGKVGEALEDGSLSREDLRSKFKGELSLIADTAGTIHAMAILENRAIERMVRSLPPDFLEMDHASRFEVILAIFIPLERPVVEEPSAREQKGQENYARVNILEDVLATFSGALQQGHELHTYVVKLPCIPQYAQIDDITELTTGNLVQPMGPMMQSQTKAICPEKPGHALSNRPETTSTELEAAHNALVAGRI